MRTSRKPSAGRGGTTTRDADAGEKQGSRTQAAAATRRGRGKPRTAPRRDGRLPRWVFYAAIAVVVVLAAAAVFFTGRVVATQHAVDAQQTRRQTILRAARQGALNFTTIGYKHVDRDIGRVIDGAAGDFKQSYKRNRDTVEETVKKNKSTSKGEVLGAGLVSVDPDSAVALVVVDSRVTNVAYKEPTVRHYRMRLTMVHDKSGRWLVSNLEFVA
ncbi:MAG: hypothetical protein ACRDMV_06025 [Streptosporangiales bacterium]